MGLLLIVQAVVVYDHLEFGQVVSVRTQDDNYKRPVVKLMRQLTPCWQHFGTYKSWLHSRSLGSHIMVQSDMSNLLKTELRPVKIKCVYIYIYIVYPIPAL